MEKIRYMISDAAQLVAVESHVLRYWEDELELTIPRNEMGHRYYTKENIQEFQKIKELKEQGYQLKAIRMLLHNDHVEEFQALTQMAPTQIPKEQVPARCVRESTTSAEDRMAQFRELMSDIVGHAIAANNEELSITIGQEVQERVLKEMNYLMREQEEAEEARYKKLDAAIRGKLQRKRFFFKKESKDAAKQNSIEAKEAYSNVN